MSDASKPYLIKLVRDRAVSRVNDRHVIDYAPIHNLNVAVRALRAKLVEEAVEYVLDPCVGELADVLEVVEALAEHDQALGTPRPGDPMWSVRREADRRRLERGGFDGLTGMFAVPDTEEGS